MIALNRFRIGQLDDYSTFRLSQRLYGREEEVKLLVRSYQRVAGLLPHSSSDTQTSDPANGETQLAGGLLSTVPSMREDAEPHLFLIKGYSGIGKVSDWPCIRDAWSGCEQLPW